MPAATRSSARTLGAGLIVYLTNHVVSHVPNRALRHGWYRRVVGIGVASETVVQLGTQIWFYSPRNARRSAIRIGRGTQINQGAILDCRGGITIGEHVSISPQAAIVTADHDRDAPGFPLRHRRVVIEDHVWIGMRAVILPGVHIGRGAVVAAGAVVTKDVEAGSVVAGVPARRVAFRDSDAVDYELTEPPAPFS